MANGSRHSMFQVLESSYGVTPATPAWKPIRHNTTNIGLTKNTLQSEELRSDRQIADFRHGTRQVGGEIAVELSYGSFDDALEALLCGTWAEVGVTGSDGDVLKVGTTRRSFSVLRHFEDLGAGQKPYHLFTGVEYNTFKLSVTTEAIVKATFGVVGKDLALAESAPAGSTYAAATTAAGMDSFTGVLTEGGSQIAIVTEIELTLENGVEPRFVIGSKTSIRPSIGRSVATGQITAYFEDATLLEKFINETSSSLEFELGDGTNTYTFSVPKLKYTGGQPDVQGEGPILLTMPFQAVLNASDATQLKITRNAA